MVIGTFSLIIIIFLYVLYLRYFPIKGIPCIDVNSDQIEQLKLKLDIRDYNSSSKREVKGSITMPVAYLKRYYREIPSKEVHVIASDVMEKNLGIRFLRNKGFKVSSYTITDCKCE
ncbi:sulfurtransferase [Aquibacillus koreensis]|uniref:Sulfurtransferase n=1 Tax=Aquibacillus koreensis TaxID=279446 RepID=A0A9X4AHZ7_9BACI|nr:sulfurtransferase [Aquibacillus koreensis]MCT2535763.1 sulfurtransferase [Aquibacillus koreensis]MDC3420219.1 sulfurtransferase [Aquibacillus koreensis]